MRISAQIFQCTPEVVESIFTRRLWGAFGGSASAETGVKQKSIILRGCVAALLQPPLRVVKSLKNFIEDRYAVKNVDVSSRKRRGANRFKAPLLAKEADGSFSRPHRVNPETGQYRGKQVLDLEV